MLTSVVTVCGFQAKRTAESQGHFTLAWMSLPSLLGVFTQRALDSASYTS